MKALKIATIVLAASIMCSAKNAWPQSLPEETGDLEFATQLLAQSQYQFAATSYEDFIHHFPHSPLLANAYIGAGDSHYYLKEPERALRFYQQYENQFPNGKDKWIVLLREAQCFYIGGKATQALAKLNAINPAQVQARFQPAYYFYLGLALLDRGELKKAGENFEKVIQIKPDSEYSTLAYLRLAGILSQTGNNDTALELYNTAMQSSNSPETRGQVELMQGIAYLQNQQYDMAAIAFKNIVERYPSFPVAHDAAVNWFIALIKANQPDQLLAEYNTRFKDNFDDPQSGPIHILAADALLSEKKNSDATAILDQVINAPQMSQKVKNEAILRKAKIMTDGGQSDQAMQIINSQTGSGNTDQSLQLLKGQNYLELHEDDQAWKIFADAVKSNPDNATAYCYEAHTRHDQGNDAAAASLFMQCFNKSSDDNYRQEALFSAAVMYGKSNNTDQSIKTSQQYIKNYPQGPHADEVTYDLADDYTANKQYDEAIRLLKMLAESSSYKYPMQAFFEIAYNLQLENKNQDALKLYGIVINQHANDELTLMALKNSMMIDAQNNDDDKTAENMDTIIDRFPSNDLTNDDYLWLIDHWKNKKDTKRLQKTQAAYDKDKDAGELK